MSKKSPIQELRKLLILAFPSADDLKRFIGNWYEDLIHVVSWQGSRWQQVRAWRR